MGIEKDENIIKIFEKIEELKKDIESLPHFFSVGELNAQMARNKQAIVVLKARVDELEKPKETK